MLKRLRKAKEDFNRFSIECAIEAQNMQENAANLTPKNRNLARFIMFAFASLFATIFITVGYYEVVYAAAGGAGIEGVFTRINTQMTTVLNQLRVISTIIAAVMLVVCFLWKMFSRNQRSVDEAGSWIKRILIAWAGINAIGFILTFIQGLIGQDQQLPTLGPIGG